MIRLNDTLGFIAHPNTGSRSVREALESIGAVEVGGYHEMHDQTLAETNECLCTIRNPFDLMASWYYRTQPGPGVMEFNEWLPWTLEGNRDYEGPGGSLYYGMWSCSLCCRFEHLQDDFDMVMGYLILPKIELGHIGKTKRPKVYRDLYNKSSRILIQDTYGEQLDWGKYTF